jgi:hypothetical protein
MDRELRTMPISLTPAQTGMTARPADLDELFLRYYRHDRREARI